MFRDTHLLNRLVIQWFANNGRDFPWRKTMDPYHVLIAEVLLRRTQAKRVVEPYGYLIQRYPTPDNLAHADVYELRKFFKPLGLVKRADLLIKAAKCIVCEHGGQIPNKIKAVSSLPGMGIYSSCAVVCLAFGESVPMIDESTGRLLKRVFDIHLRGPAYSNREFLEMAASIVPMEQARDFNLGLIDLAAAFCHHTSPDCCNCPIARLCLDYRNRVHGDSDGFCHS
jgi:A/G-specific adenine glycosylase